MHENEIFNEFVVEAFELLSEAEYLFLSIENEKQDLSICYDSILRAFHSVKGSASMFGKNDLHSHMHKLETLLQSQKKTLEVVKINHLLAGIDIAKILLSGEKIPLKYADFSFDEFDKLPSLTGDNKEIISHEMIKLIGVIDIPIDQSIDLVKKSFLQKIKLTVDDIDPQHEKIFQMILKLKKSLVINENNKEINLKILNDLKFYTEAHFKYEETMLEHYDY